MLVVSINILSWSEQDENGMRIFGIKYGRKSGIQKKSVRARRFYG